MRLSFRFAFPLLLLGTFVRTSPALALDPAPASPAAERVAATLRGLALDASDQPVASASVRLSGTTRATTTDGEGRFELGGLAPGRFLVEIESARAGRGIATVELAAGGSTEIEVRLDFEVHGETVTVTASPEPRAADELARPVAVMDGLELLAAVEPSLGETLARQPGVSSTYFGPGASRPVIRGLGGDRIRVLDNGLGAGDVSSTSPDHAVAADALGAEQIEIVRGPATLLYGSSAVGGVVNVLDGSIPDHRPEERISGTVTLRGGTVGDERAGAVTLGGGAGAFAWSVAGSKREAGDVDIPGFAESRALRAAEEAEHPEDEGHEEEEAFGTLPNSATEAESVKVGLSWVGDAGFLGVSLSGFDTLYGVPGHAHAHEEHEEDGAVHGEDEEEVEDAVRIDMRQRRVDVRGAISRDFGILRGLRLRAGSYSYDHDELEGDAIGTRFETDGWEARVEAPHRPFGRVTGTWGGQASSRDFAAVGEEAFVPANASDAFALFAFEEIAAGPWTWQLGGRWESQDLSTVAGTLPDRSFSGVSASAGLSRELSEAASVSVSLSRSVTLPNPEALYSEGAHLATRTYEIGDPALDEEISLAADAGFHYSGDRFHADASAFYNRVDDFVAESFTGEEIDGLPVVRFGATDALLYGVELEAHFALLHEHPHHLELDLTYDFVRGEERATGTPLPRIPSARYGGGLTYRGDRWLADAALTRVTKADRLAPFETTTEAYTLVDASVGYRLFLGETVHDILLSGRNLTDEEARVHASYLKDLAPLPGRDVRLSYRISF